MRVLSIRRSLLLSVVLSDVCLCGVAMPAAFAGAPSCTPIANGQLGGPSATHAQSVMLCTGGDTGIAYRATGGALTVNLNADPINGHGILVADDTLGRNITVNNGLPSSGYAAGSILSTDATGFAVYLKSSGGNVQFTSNPGGTISYTGSTSGAAVAGLTSGNGTVTLTTYDTVTDLAGTSIGAQSANGAIAIAAYGNVSASLDALYAQASGNGNVTVITGAAGAPVTIATADSALHDAVNAVSHGGNVTVTTNGNSIGELLANTSGSGNILLTANGDVTATGGNSAIYTNTDAGTITITTNGNLTDNLVATTGTGAITVTTNGAISQADSFASIFATSSSGNVTVTANGTIANSIDAWTQGSGTVSVTANGALNNIQTADTLSAMAMNGAVTVTVNSAQVHGVMGQTAIYADSLAGASSVSLGDSVTITGPSIGIYTSSGSSVATVTNGANDAITAADSNGDAGGITASSNAAPAIAGLTASVLTGAGNTITVTGDDSAGITALNQGSGLGGLSIATGNNNTVTVTGSNAAALLATTLDGTFSNGSFDGAGDVKIMIGANNILRVNAGSGSGLASGGVVGLTDGGNVDVEWAGAGGSITVGAATGVTTVGVLVGTGPGASDTASPVTSLQTLTLITGIGTAITSANGAGIVAANFNYGQTIVISNGPIVASVTSGTGLLSTLLNGALGANLQGGGLVVLGMGPTSVTSNGTITVTGGHGINALGQGSLSVANNAAITADQSAINDISGGTFTLVNNATVAGAGTAALPVIGFAALGSASVTNGANGIIRSNVGLVTDIAIKAIQSGGAVSLANSGVIIGRIDLSNAASAVVTNSAVWRTSGASVITAAVVNNSGSIQTTGTTSLTGVTSLNNTGVLDLHGGNPAVGDVLSINGALAGNSGSKLSIDSFLGSAGSTACGNLSDCIHVGSSSGVTSVIVHNTATLAVAGYNPAGILVATGASAGSNFVLDSASTGYDAKTGTISEGLFAYSLGYNAGTKEVRLVSAPDTLAFQLPVLGTAVQNIWYETSPWLSRQADLRDQLGVDGQGKVTPGLWVKGVGNFLHRNTATTLSGSTLSQQSNYNQDSYAVVVGADAGMGDSHGGTLIGGLMAGYLRSTVDFQITPSNADFSGFLIGGYGTYLNDGWVIDAAVKANLLTVKYAASGTALFAANPNATSVGGEIEAGKRWNFADGLFLEPVISGSYLSSSIDDAVTLGTATHFGDAKSARASAGLRFGTAMSYANGTMVTLSLTGRAWDEFDGTSSATLLAGTPAPLQDRFSGTFGEVSGSANIFGGDSGWSGFLNGGVKFRSGFDSKTLAIGIRRHW